MPRWNKRSARRLSEHQRALLTWDLAILCDTNHLEARNDEVLVEEAFGSWEEARLAYLDHRIEILTANIREFPGRRPWSFWAFDRHPEVKDVDRGAGQPVVTSYGYRPDRIKTPELDEQRRLLEEWDMLTTTEKAQLARMDETPGGKW